MGALAAARKPSAGTSATEGLLQTRELKVHFGGVHAVDGVDLDLPQGRDPRPDRPERRGKDDAGERVVRVREADVRERVPERRGRHRLEPRPLGPARARRGRSSPCGCSRGSPCSRTSSSEGSASGCAGRRRATRARELLARLGLADKADSLATGLPHGLERRLGNRSVRSRRSRRSSSWTSRLRVSTSGRATSSSGR